MTDPRLVNLPITRFLELLGSGTPTPGGGGVTALTGALAASLGAMVAGLTLGREKYRTSWPRMEAALAILERSRARLVDLVDLDAQAYDLVTQALALPKDDADRKAARDLALAEAFLQATEIPFQTLQEIQRLLQALKTVLDHGNPNGLSDVGVGILLLRAAGQGAAYNVRVNLSQLKDPDRAREFADRTSELLAEIRQATGRMERAVEARM